jgi:hypothetical protein
MRLSELKDILDKTQVAHSYYSLSPKDFSSSDPNEYATETTSVCLHRETVGIRFFILDRGDKYHEKVFTDEHIACMHFLKIVAYDFPILKKYLAATA